MVFPFLGFIILKDFVEHVIPAGKCDFWLASSPGKGVTTPSGSWKWVLHSGHLQKDLDSCTYTGKEGFSHKKGTVILSPHWFLEEKKPKTSYQFPLARSSLMWRHSYPFLYSHHDILDAFLETVWEPRKNSRSPSLPTKKEEVDKKVLWCLNHLRAQRRIAALLGGRGMVQQQNTCTK